MKARYQCRLTDLCAVEPFSSRTSRQLVASFRSLRTRNIMLQEQLKPFRTHRNQNSSDTYQIWFFVVVRTPVRPIPESMRCEREHRSASHANPQTSERLARPMRLKPKFVSRTNAKVGVPIPQCKVSEGDCCNYSPDCVKPTRERGSRIR